MNKKLDLSALQIGLISALVLVLGTVIGNQLAQSPEATGARGGDQTPTVKRLTGHIELSGVKFTVAAIFTGNSNEDQGRNDRDEEGAVDDGEELGASGDGVANVQGNMNIHGTVVSPPDARGEVEEVVLPHAGYDHWCVNFEIESLEDFNVLVYVRDVGDGRTTFDQIAFSGGFGASCAQYPAPEAEFETVSAGNFRSVL